MAMLDYHLLKGKQLMLGRLKETDIADIVSWYEDEEFLRNLDAIPSFPKRENEIEKWINNKNDNTYTMAIRLLDTKKIIGYVEFDGILWNHRNTWLSIAIGGNNRGQGYGKEALGLAINFAFQELNLHRIQLTVFEYNHRAISLYEKCGFKKEGSHREFLERDGRRYDMHLYGLLRHEWEKKKE
jgi:RimJ/RimL family protein N-acetyltransferase